MKKTKPETTPDTTQEKWTITQRSGGWLLARKGAQVKRVAYQRGKREAITNWGGLHFTIPVKAARPGAGASGPGADESSDPLISAQFPGKIRKVLVKEGEAVTSGQKLLLVEAMKMEFAIEARFEGTVTKIFVEEGALIQPGADLVKLEKKS